MQHSRKDTSQFNNRNSSRNPSSNKFTYVNPKRATLKSQTPCIHFRKGKCLNDNCPFLHKSSTINDASSELKS